MKVAGMIIYLTKKKPVKMAVFGVLIRSEVDKNRSLWFHFGSRHLNSLSPISLKCVVSLVYSTIRAMSLHTVNAHCIFLKSMLSIRLDISLLQYVYVYVWLIIIFLCFVLYRIRHRGPDWSGCITTGNHIMAHERLAIVGVGKFRESKKKKRYKPICCLTDGIFL